VLRATVDRHCELVSRIILISKKTAKRRSQIDSALRACRDAFMEVSIYSSCKFVGQIERIKC